MSSGSPTRLKQRLTPSGSFWNSPLMRKKRRLASHDRQSMLQLCCSMRGLLCPIWRKTMIECRSVFKVAGLVVSDLSRDEQIQTLAETVHDEISLEQLGHPDENEGV